MFQNIFIYCCKVVVKSLYSNLHFKSNIAMSESKKLVSLCPKSLSECMFSVVQGALCSAGLINSSG